MTTDIYVLDGFDDEREFVTMNIYNEKILQGLRRIHYPQGQFTVAPSGNFLMSTVCMDFICMTFLILWCDSYWNLITLNFR